ncbi:NUDIX domain-containing protein [Paracoccus sp. XHP0099]|uniref:NUDIX domain-containing protein n=2 Tax=Paracoccus marinaquae TaxID=2841926 RepID=A0ABS6AGZ5_9RHOB|nr:NUDIX domain-containing protein [Paracoccus marinaquae]MBU3029779.1 NUDIX domain-containing protein [Paracoccus marinaquae]
MLRVLGAEAIGAPVTLAAGLIGGGRAGIVAGDWPALSPGRGETQAVAVRPGPALWRYAAVMGLSVWHLAGRALMGVQAQPGDGAAWPRSDWLPELAAAIAREILDQPLAIEPEDIAARLPMIGVWAESRLRGASGPVSGGDLVARRGAQDVRLHGRREPYAGFFSVDVWNLSHRTHAGGFTPAITREGFVMGDAVVVLPWDPLRDRILLIEQFRFGPALRRDPQPWLLEPIAGRVDAGEAVEAAARREAREEADLHLRHLFPAVHHYPSPGAVTEFLYLYVGIADLPDGVAGVHGLDGEAEDIRGHLVGRDRLLRMVLQGQITNGPLALLALWLEQKAPDLRRELAAS